jgi:Tol biopolymer transport system component
VIANEKDKDEEQKIWYTRKNNYKWIKPVRIPMQFAETRSPSLSPDGQKLYFLTNDPDSDPNEMPPKSILWAKQINDSSWNNIQRVEGLLPKLEKQMIMSYCFASNGNLYFDVGGPDKTGKWSWRIYFSKYKDGEYMEPQLMGNMINEGRVCQYPFVAPDESYLIFSSDREGTFGWGDLYISYRNDKGEWTVPVNMGKTINTPSQERSPSVSPDGRYLFFTRHNQHTFQDYYWIDAKIIDVLRSNK